MIALDLAHLFARLVHDHAVQQDALERRLAHEVDAHHHHASDPEEQNVVRRGQVTGWVELLQGGGGYYSNQQVFQNFTAQRSSFQVSQLANQSWNSMVGALQNIAAVGDLISSAACMPRS